MFLSSSLSSAEVAFQEKGIKIAPVVLTAGSRGLGALHAQHREIISTKAHQDQPGCPPLQPEISARWGGKKYLSGPILPPWLVLPSKRLGWPWGAHTTASADGSGLEGDAQEGMELQLRQGEL